MRRRAGAAELCISSARTNRDGGSSCTFYGLRPALCKAAVPRACPSGGAGGFAAERAVREGSDGVDDEGGMFSLLSIWDAAA